MSRGRRRASSWPSFADWGSRATDDLHRRRRFDDLDRRHPGSARGSRLAGRRGHLGGGRGANLRERRPLVQLSRVHGARHADRRDRDHPRTRRFSSSARWSLARSSVLSPPSALRWSGVGHRCCAWPDDPCCSLAVGIPTAIVLTSLVGRALGWITALVTSPGHGPRPASSTRPTSGPSRRGDCCSGGRPVTDLGQGRRPARRLHLGDDGAGRGQCRTGAAFGAWHEVWGAFSQLVLNLVCLIVAGVATLAAQRIAFEHRVRRSEA